MQQKRKKNKKKNKTNTLYGETQNADCGYGRAKC